MANANAVGLGLIKAAIEEEVWRFGMTIDKSDLAPDNVIASAILDTPKMYVEIARTVLEEEFKGEAQEVGLKEGVAYLGWNGKIKKQLPQEVIEAVNKAVERIKSGEYRVPGEMD